MKNVLLITSCLFLSCICYGQITVQVMQNPNPNLSTWENRQNVVTVTVNNRAGASEVRFSTQLKIDGKITAFTNIDQMPLVTLERGLNRFTIDEVMPYRAVEIAEVNTRNVARTGQLPAGNYEMCVSMVDQQNQPVKGFQEACSVFLLTQIQVPILINPTAGTILQKNVRPTFSWTPATPVSPGTRVTYKLQVFEVLEGQGIMQALQGNRPIILEEIEGLTQFWPTEWDIPESNNPFVWTVQALDENGNALGENNGLASPQSFRIDNNAGGGQKIADGEPWVQCLGHVCSIKGVKLEIHVPFDAVTTGSTTYKVLSYSISIKYYATASQVLAEFGSTGASEVDDWIGYVSASSGIKYCDKNGYPIVDQVVYEIHKTNPNNYNGNTNELHASGACLNYGTYTSLAIHYNSYNNSYLDVPTSCVEGCVGGGGVDGGDPGSGSNGTNAAGQTIDDITLDPIDGDGGISPGGGGLIGHDAADSELDMPDIIWVDMGDDVFKPYHGGKGNLSKKDFCFCADGTYCEGKANCDCCPTKKENNDVKKARPANNCKCEVGNKKFMVVSEKDCITACASFKKDHSGRASGRRQHGPVKY